MFINEIKQLWERQPTDNENEAIVNAQAEAMKKFFSYLVDQEQIFADKLIGLEAEEMKEDAGSEDKEMAGKNESSIKDEEEKKKLEEEDLQHKIELKIKEEVKEYSNLENILLSAREKDNAGQENATNKESDPLIGEECKDTENKEINVNDAPENNEEESKKEDKKESQDESVPMVIESSTFKQENAATEKPTPEQSNNPQ
eukprot:TRINITY_DN932_c0_g11_i1.p2 TRINITY_DN932_c0_g11~~TRINITY_DN932_c0_g11_i1.p2  ORF type:complete len:201 (-),score=79.85 TRINITY_DN932_c0_g11_i1:119-721(-)